MRRTVGNLANVIGGEAALRVANFVAAVFLARVGGTWVFGTYAASLAYVTIATMLADNGLQIAAVREISSTPDAISPIASRLYISKTLLFLPMLMILAVIGRVAHLSALQWSIAAIIAARAILQSYCQLQVAILKAVDSMRAIGFIQGTHSLVLLLLLWHCYASGRSIYFLLWALVIGQTLEMLLEAAWLWSLGLRPVNVRFEDCWRLLRGSTSVGITLAVANAILRLDVIILSLIAGAAAAGVFAAAQSVIVIVYVVGWLLGSVLLADMTRLNESQSDLKHFMQRWILIISSTLVPLTIIGIFLGPPLVRSIFGPKFAPSGTLLALMLPAVPFIVLNSLHLHRTFAIQSARAHLGTYLRAAALTIILDSCLALVFGATGVAVAVVLREVIVFISFCLLHAKWQSRTEVEVA